jgi:MoxR-like ATPase
MAKTKLFEAWSFRLQQPAPFDDPKYAGSKSMGFSQYNTSSTAQKSTLHAPTMRALLAYAKLVSATENGQSVDGLGAIGHQGTTYRISEYRSANKTDCVVFNPVTGKFNAAQVEDGTQALKPYSVGAGNGTGSGLLFCLMPVLNEDDEFRQKFQEFVSLLESGWADMDAAFECALTLCDNVYRRIENSKQLGSDGVKISIPTTGNISVITQMAMDSGNYAPTGASYGEFTIMQMSGTPTAKVSSFQKEDFVAKYVLSNRTLTAREQAMVPTLPDWYIIPKEVVRVCEHAKVTTASSQPMRNFLFRGEAGTGKTMGAQAIAAGLNLPYTLMTCSANTEITDLVGQFIPDTGNSQSDSNCTELPKISDITMHPPSVYMMLTGEYDEEKTEDDVLQKLIEIAVGNLMEKEETPGQRIRYVDTPLVEAIRHGYVCELQEPSCIANPGVLVGLNSLLDNCQVITLPTGERVKRHPDTVIVVTTNSDYSGCRDMNQSVISRMDLIYDMEAPDLNTMVKRVMNVTGFADEQEATKMAVVVRDVAERCRQTMITDGSCGMREFKSWVLSTMVTHDPYESALSTIISSASADPDNRAELISACLEPQYTRTI